VTCNKVVKPEGYKKDRNRLRSNSFDSINPKKDLILKSGYL
jgi:hypothetical protein